MSSRSPKLSLQAKRGEYIAPLQPSARTRRTKPGESIVKPWPRELLDDCGRNTEMLWEAMADQGYKTSNNCLYVRSRGPNSK